MTVEITMLKSLMGTPFYRKGSTHEIDEQTAEKWAAKGLCVINKKSSTNAKQSKRTTKRGAGKRSTSKSLAKSGE